MAYNRNLQHFTSSQELANLWQPSQTYLENQLVIYNNSLYRALVSPSHVSSSDFIADLAANKWAGISAEVNGTSFTFAGFNSSGSLFSVPGWTFDNDGGLQIGAQNSITVPSAAADYISISVSPTVSNVGLTNLSGVQLNSPINEIVANYNGFQVFGYGSSRPDNFTAYRSQTNYAGTGANIIHFTAGGNSDCSGTAVGFEFNSAGNANIIQGVSLAPSGDAATITGVLIAPSGSYTDATGIKIDLTSVTTTNRPAGLDIIGGALNSSIVFQTTSYLPSLVDSANIIRPTFEVNSPISGTDVLMTNLAGFMDFNDDYSGTGVASLDLGAVSVGFVSQVAANAGILVDSVTMSLAGLAIDSTSAGGTIMDAHLYRGSAFDFGGSLTINSLYGLKIENTLSSKATYTWGIAVEDVGAENYLAKSLKIGGLNSVSDNTIGLEIDDAKTVKLPSFTTLEKTSLPNIAGTIVYDETSGTISVNNGTAWVDFGSGAGAGQTLPNGAVLTGTYNGSVLVLGDCTLSGTDVTINGDFTVLGGIFTTDSPNITINGDLRVFNGFDYSTTNPSTLTILGDTYFYNVNTTSRLTTVAVGSSAVTANSSSTYFTYSPGLDTTSSITAITNFYNKYLSRGNVGASISTDTYVIITSGPYSGTRFTVDASGLNEFYTEDFDTSLLTNGTTFTYYYSYGENYSLIARSINVGNTVTIGGDVYSTLPNSNFFGAVFTLSPSPLATGLVKSNGGSLTIRGKVEALQVYLNGFDIGGGDGGNFRLFAGAYSCTVFLNGGNGTATFSAGNGGSADFSGGGNVIVQTSGGNATSSASILLATGGNGGLVTLSGNGGSSYAFNASSVGGNSIAPATTGGNAGSINVAFSVASISISGISSVGGNCSTGFSGKPGNIFLGAASVFASSIVMSKGVGLNPTTTSDLTLAAGFIGINNLNTISTVRKIAASNTTTLLRVKNFATTGVLTGHTGLTTADQSGISDGRVYTYNNTLARWQYTTATTA